MPEVEDADGRQWDVIVEALKYVPALPFLLAVAAQC
jgi:hypothetical protein